MVARSISPGRPPPTLRMTSCSARPIVALARLPGPERVDAVVHADRPGDRTVDDEDRAAEPRGREQPVHVELVGARALDARRAPPGRYSGRQPAITALIATFSTVHSTRSGGASTTTSSAARVVPASMRTTRSGVGGTRGRPSDQPRSYIASASSSSAPSTTRRGLQATLALPGRAGRGDGGVHASATRSRGGGAGGRGRARRRPCTPPTGRGSSRRRGRPRRRRRRGAAWARCRGRGRSSRRGRGRRPRRRWPRGTSGRPGSRR